MIRKVRTANGVVAGRQGKNARVTVYLGIPFAAPPVGNLRWREPQPAADWEGERECFTFAPISMQEIPGLADNVYTREWHVNPDIPMSEDCLYLNVWTPAVTGEKSLPVLVWFFGGGYQVGYTAEMEFDGEALAARGIVVVTVNYRVGAFGFLAHPELTAENPQAPANFGLLDQQAGLRWVQANIAAFGGDPARVSIGGQSAGGGSVQFQVANRDNAGLFGSAFIMSGAFRDPYREEDPTRMMPIGRLEKTGAEFFSFLGVKTLAEARALPAEYIRDRYEVYRRGNLTFRPCLDGVFAKEDPYRAIAEGRALDVPILAGGTADEFLASLPADSEGLLEEMARNRFGEDADAFLACPEAHVRTAAGELAPASRIEYAVKHLARESAKNGKAAPWYVYRFAGDIPGWDDPGNFHSSDLWFFFDNLQACWRPFVGRHYDLARQMADAWTAFIKTGSPNGTGKNGDALPLWQPYEKETSEMMVFDREGAHAESGESAFGELLIRRIR